MCGLVPCKYQTVTTVRVTSILSKSPLNFFSWLVMPSLSRCATSLSVASLATKNFFM